MKYTIPLFALLIITVLCCKKDDLDCPPDLPCATQTGANTFGCYIDGKPWVADVAPYIWDPMVHKLQAWLDEPDYGTYHNNFLHIAASSVDSFAHDFISMTFAPVTSIGSLDHNFLTTFFSINSYLTSGLYSIDTTAPYDIALTKIDHKSRIVSGYFSFTALTKGKEDTIHVTDGRFDVRYYPE